MTKIQYKKVLLRERKRHTTRRVAIAISCYSRRGGPLTKKNFPVWTCIKPNLVSKNFPFTGGGGGSLDKNFFSGLNMYQAKSGVKIFSLYWGWGSGPWQKNFFRSEHVSSQIWCQKFFPLLGGGGPWQNFFLWSEHVSSQIWCQKFFPFTGGGGWPLTKNFFFPVWTCIKPNLVSKIFPFTGGGWPLTKNFFPIWTCIKPNLVSKNVSLYWGGSGPWQNYFFAVWTCIKPNLVSKNFPFTETEYPPPLNRHTPVKT